MFDIKKELQKLPTKPGVYLMHDKEDKIIYVGKAKVLKNRVRQYFQKNNRHSLKIENMVKNISYFEYIVTDSELEALVLEANLIKEHRPKYNTLLKDDKSYPFIKLTKKESYPRLLFSRDMKHDENKYFGPYTSAFAVKEVIDLLCRLYGLRTCNRNLPKDVGKKRECLDYHIGKCSAPCNDRISAAEYEKRIEKVEKFLRGDIYEEIKELEEKMNAFSENLEFEEAQKTLDLINSIKHIMQKQKIVSEDGSDRDVIGFARNEKIAILQLFFIRNGKLLGKDDFLMELAKEDAEEEILEIFIKQYYSNTPYIPPNIFLPNKINETKLLEEFLSSKKNKRVKIFIPKKGEKERLVSLANKNASLILERKNEEVARKERQTLGAIKEIASILKMDAIKRVEAYDISNLNGINTVGAMAVFVDGVPNKKEYRKFRIKEAKSSDDYGALKEVLVRRIKRALEDESSFKVLPDLILMDGGKGQVNVATKVLASFNLNIEVCGMVKDEFHKTRGLYYKNKLMPIDERSEAFKLITRIQDEAHRFAITYHKQLRGREVKTLEIEKIKGVGEKRKILLLKYFEDIDKIREADVLELTKALGNKKVALLVYEYFHSGREYVEQNKDK